jgi:hypothetical protein
MAANPADRHGGPGAGWYLRTMGGWRRISDTEAANERYEGMRHFMHDPNEDEVQAGDSGPDSGWYEVTPDGWRKLPGPPPDPFSPGFASHGNP